MVKEVVIYTYVCVAYVYTHMHICICMYVCMLSCFTHVQLFVTLWTLALQTPMFMGFSKQEYWSVLPCPPPGALLNPGIEAESLMSPALSGEFFTTSAIYFSMTFTVALSICVHD